QCRGIQRIARRILGAELPSPEGGLLGFAHLVSCSMRVQSVGMHRVDRLDLGMTLDDGHDFAPRRWPTGRQMRPQSAKEGEILRMVECPALCGRDAARACEMRGCG